MHYKTKNCTVVSRVLHCREWTSWTLKRWNAFDSDWLIFQEKSGGDFRGSASQERAQRNIPTERTLNT